MICISTQRHTHIHIRIEKDKQTDRQTHTHTHDNTHTLQVSLHWSEADGVHLEALSADLFAGPEHSSVVCKLQLDHCIFTGDRSTAVGGSKTSPDYLEIVLASGEREGVCVCQCVHVWVCGCACVWVVCVHVHCNEWVHPYSSLCSASSK